MLSNPSEKRPNEETWESHEQQRFRETTAMSYAHRYLSRDFGAPSGYGVQKKARLAMLAAVRERLPNDTAWTAARFNYYIKRAKEERLSQDKPASSPVRSQAEEVVEEEEVTPDLSTKEAKETVQKARAEAARKWHDELDSRHRLGQVHSKTPLSTILADTEKKFTLPAATLKSSQVYAQGKKEEHERSFGSGRPSRRRDGAEHDDDEPAVTPAPPVADVPPEPNSLEAKALNDLGYSRMARKPPGWKKILAMRVETYKIMARAEAAEAELAAAVAAAASAATPAASEGDDHPPLDSPPN